MRITTAYVLTLLLSAAAAAPAPAQTLSRAEAVAQAVAANPQVKLSLEQAAYIEGTILKARADALPDLSWNTVAARTRDPGLLNSPNFEQFPPEFRSALNPIPTNSFMTTADVKQTLFSFKLGNALAAAKIAGSAAEKDVERARRATALEAVRAYNQLLFAIEELRVIQSNVDARQSHLEFARNRRAAGVATELEVLRAEVDVENQKAEAMRAENDVAAARAQLNTVMQRPTGAAIQPTDTLQPVEFDTTLEDAVARAMSARPELAGLKLQQDIQDRLVNVAAAESKPTFDLNGSYGFAVRKPENLFHVNYARWSTAVTVRWPLFDGWRTAGNVAQARAQKNQVTHQITALESQIRLEVQNAYDALALANRVMQAAELNVTQARRVFEMTEANYRLGASTPLDVIDAQQALRQAENTRNQALFVHANARAALRYVMGQDPLD